MRALIYAYLPKGTNSQPPSEANSQLSVSPPDVRRWRIHQWRDWLRNLWKPRHYLNRAEVRDMMRHMGLEPPGIEYFRIDTRAFKRVLAEVYDAAPATAQTDGSGIPISKASPGASLPNSRPVANSPVENGHSGGQGAAILAVEVPTSHKTIAADVAPADSTQPAESAVENEEYYRRFFVSLAVPILKRVPESTPDNHEKRRTAEQNVIYSSQLPQTSSPFMVTLEANGYVLFRLINSRLDELRNACDLLVNRINQYNSEHLDAPLRVDGNIKILEHDLEQSTISGEYRPSLWYIAAKYASLNLWIIVALAIIIAAMWYGMVYATVHNYSGLYENLLRFMPGPVMELF
jgi:hypothetical protein